MLEREMKGRRGRRRERLLELDEVEERLKPFGRRYLGVRAIPLDALVGTDSRANSFTRDFRPLHSFSRDRMRSLESAFADGAFPPIVTVKLGETYFVIDGHHRAALARRAGADMIDADVTELIARVPLPEGADMLDVVLRQLERIFLEDSGLAEARPGDRIAVSRPAHYLELLENVQVPRLPQDEGFPARPLRRGDRGRLVRLDLHADPGGDRAPASEACVQGRARGRPVPPAPSAPARCFPQDRLPTSRADCRLSHRRRRSAPASVVWPRHPFPGLETNGSAKAAPGLVELKVLGRNGSV
jgi:hypothetical protein